MLFFAPVPKILIRQHRPIADIRQVLTTRRWHQTGRCPDRPTNCCLDKRGRPAPLLPGGPSNILVPTVVMRRYDKHGVELRVLLIIQRIDKAGE